MSARQKTVKCVLPLPQGALDTLTRATAEGGGKKGGFYKPLPIQFRRDGFNYRQIAREGDAAIYEQRWTGCMEPSGCYEVIRIRCRERFQIGDKSVEPSEVYPNSEAWGGDGFTFTDKDTAFKKLRTLFDDARIRHNGIIREVSYEK
jgi:hypothetical protein